MCGLSKHDAKFSASRFLTKTCVIPHERDSSTLTLKSSGGHVIAGFSLRLDITPAAFPVAYQPLLYKHVEAGVVVVATASGQSAQLLAHSAAESGNIATAAHLYGGTYIQLKVAFRKFSIYQQADLQRL
ncbi:hypothetical protein B0H19DRAFT_1247556 [Mycena capillaripes]|nr:hypothetical protein B0H19DRAFT_1247556 [Mycena capillaripes]